LLFYRAALPLSSKTLNFVAGIIRRHRTSIGSPWRALNPGEQALPVLVYLKKDQTYDQVAAGFDVSTTTAWRQVDETVALPAGRAPKLRRAAREATKAGYPHVVVAGTLIATGRVAADRPSRSGKHQRHGMNPQVIASPCGEILRVSGALPGPVHDKRAGWIGGVPDELEAAGLVVLAGKGYQGAAHAKLPYRERTSPNPGRKPIARTRNSGPPASGRTPGSSRGGSSASSAAAPGKPERSPRPSTCFRPARHNQDEKDSM
jgi:hypothetical protein